MNFVWIYLPIKNYDNTGTNVAFSTTSDTAAGWNLSRYCSPRGSDRFQRFATTDQPLTACSNVLYVLNLHLHFFSTHVKSHCIGESFGCQTPDKDLSTSSSRLQSTPGPELHGSFTAEEQLVGYLGPLQYVQLLVSAIFCSAQGVID